MKKPTYEMIIEALKRVDHSLKTYYLGEYPYPLASGNCGLAALAISRVLNDYGINHHFHIITTTDFDENPCPDTWELARDYQTTPDHISVIMREGYVDYSFGDKDEIDNFMDEHEEYHGQCEFVDINDHHLPDLRDYVLENTTCWMDDGEEIIYESLTHELQKIIDLTPSYEMIAA